MAATTLHWRRLAPVTIAGTAIHQILDGIYAAGTAATYYDGSARTPGSGNAWTFSRFQSGGTTTEAVYATPATGALNHRAIFAGAAGAKTPTMASPDTWAVSTVLAGLAKNAGAFNAWDNVAPFTSGQFYGYWRACGSTTITKVHVLESAECLLVMFESSVGLCFPVLVGALFDPNTSAAGSKESDGLRYGLFTGPATAGLSTTFHEVTSTFLGYGSTANTAAHGMVADIGAVSTFSTLARVVLTPATGTSTTYLTNASSEVIGIPIMHRKSAAAPGDVYVGRLREVYHIKDSVSGAIHRTSGAVDVWYCVASSTAAANNAIGLGV